MTFLKLKSVPEKYKNKTYDLVDGGYISELLSRSFIPKYIGRRRVVIKPEQQLCINISDELRRFPVSGKLKAVWTHVPNEGNRSRLNGAILKAMGMIPGYADYVFCWDNGSGTIEIKADKGKPTELQKLFARWCDDSGVKYALCRSVEEVMDSLKSWGVLCE